MGVSGPKKIDNMEDLIKALRGCATDKEKFALANENIHLPKNLWHIGDIFAQISHMFDNTNQESAQKLLAHYIINNFNTIAGTEAAKEDFKFQCAFRLQEYFSKKDPRGDIATLALQDAIKQKEMKAEPVIVETSEASLQKTSLKR